MHRLVLLVILLLPVLAQSQGSSAKAPWDSLKFFVGHWHGTFQGQPGQGKGERYYEFVLKDKFLQLKSKSIYPPQEKNAKGEVHEDLGMYSYDGRRRSLCSGNFMGKVL